MDWQHYTRLLTPSDDLIHRDWAHELYEAIQERLAFAGLAAMPDFSEVPYWRWFRYILDAQSEFSAAGSIEAYSTLSTDIAAALGVSASDLSSLYYLSPSSSLPTRLLYNACRVACDLLKRRRFDLVRNGGLSRIGAASGVGSSVSGTSNQAGSSSWGGVLSAARSRFEADGGAESNPLAKTVNDDLVYGVVAFDNDSVGINTTYIVRHVALALERRVLEVSFPAVCVGLPLTFETGLTAFEEDDYFNFVIREESPLHSDNEAYAHAGDNSGYYLEGEDYYYEVATAAWCGFEGSPKAEVTGLTGTEAIKTVAVGYTPLSTSPILFHLDLAETLSDYPSPQEPAAEDRREFTWKGIGAAASIVADVSAGYNFQTPVV